MIARFIKRLLQTWRAWRIRTMEQDLAWACEQFDSYLADHSEKLHAMRRAYYAGTTTEQIERTVLQRARGY